MFDRYTDPRAVPSSFARYEASQFGSKSSNPNTFSGLLRQDQAFFSGRFLTVEDEGEIRRHIEEAKQRKNVVSLSEDLR